jgi:acetyltransferase-like isoleucine patch superfamily enzyme
MGLKNILKLIRDKNLFRSLFNFPFIISRKVKWCFYSFTFGSFGKGSTISGLIFTTNASNIFIGKNCFIGPFCRIETFTDYGSQVNKASLIIGDDCSIQHAVHIYCAVKVEIKKGCLIASGCMITDENHGMDPRKGYYVNQPLIYSPTILEEGVWLGENVSVLPGVTIGQYSIIGANSVVKNDIPDFSIAVGNPARVVKKFNFVTNTWDRL